jgi:hypothetical protein
MCHHDRELANWERERDLRDEVLDAPDDPGLEEEEGPDDALDDEREPPAPTADD